MRYCWKCGAKLGEDVDYCPKCGVAVSKYGIATASVIRPVRRREYVNPRVVFLTLLFVATAIPTFLFIIVFTNLLGFYIQRGGSLWVDWHQQVIWLQSQGTSVGMHIGFLALALICIPLFIKSALLLYEERQRSKKREAEKPATHALD